jgi:putative two-component system response regulator
MNWPKFECVVDAQFVELIYLTSPLHDIGKVGIPDSVLLKPGKLTSEEFEIMKRHTLIGGETLFASATAYPETGFIKMALDITMKHHERWDGTGYPFQLQGEQIPLCARIVSIADVYDALTTKRVYKDAYTHEDAVRIIYDSRGTHFDPDLVDAFAIVEEQMRAIRARLDVTPPVVAPITNKRKSLETELTAPFFAPS